MDRLKVRKENTRISQGEIVGIYRYTHDGVFFDEHPVLTGSVSKISDFKISIICDGRNDVDVFSASFENDFYSVVQMVNDVTFKRYNEALKRLEFYMNKPELPVNHLIKAIFDLEKTKDFTDDDKIQTL